jgi:hypothetical protein
MAGDVIAALQALLQPLAAGGAWYAFRRDQTPADEYIVYQRVVSVPNVSMQGASNLQPTRFQIDIYAKAMQRAVSIEAALLTAVAGAPFPCVPVLVRDFYEADTGLYRLSRDFTVWYSA